MAQTAPNISNRRVAGLDTLRSLAIVMVMGYHLYGRLPDGFRIFSSFGWMGVDLFFVLSGYLIGLQLFRPVSRGECVSLLSFYRNRAYRILPAYLVVLALYELWPGWREYDSISPLWEFLTFTENLFVDYSKNFAFSHVWSLCVEEHFYLLLPLIVLLLSRKAAAWKTGAVLGAFFLVGIATRSFALIHVLRPLGPDADSFSTRYIEDVYYPTWTRLDGLLAGVALASVKTFRPLWWAAWLRRANSMLIVGMALVGCAVWMFYDRFSSATGVAAASTVIGFPLLALGFALLLPAASDVRCWLGRWRVPGTQLLATLAYSLYLTHKGVAHVVNERLPRLASTKDWRAAVTYAVCCLLVAGALYLCVERPFLILRDRRSEKRRMAVDREARAEHAL